MKKKLLVCICFHFDENRINFLLNIIQNFLSYNFDTSIYIDCNDKKIFDFIKNVEKLNIKIYENLHHPHSLASMHRKTILENIEHYDYFIYTEDDMLLPENNFIEYLNNFKLLYPLDKVPSFIRLEKYENNFYVTDITEEQIDRPIFKIENKNFVNLSTPYHAFWILPQKELKESIQNNFQEFNHIGDCNREMMASYVMWGLNKTPYVLLEGEYFSKLSYSYHLPNNYSSNINTVFGKLKVDSFVFKY
jgi:hypothetical protein